MDEVTEIIIRKISIKMIRDSCWDEYDVCLDIKIKWDILLTIIRTAIEIMCPIKSFNIKQDKELWITPQLIELIKDKDISLREAKKTRDPILWNEAKRLRNECTRRLRQARADYIQENLDNDIGNQKKFWKNIQNVLPQNNNSTINEFSLIDHESQESIKFENTATYINDFLTNIGPSLAQNCNLQWEYTGNHIDEDLTDITTNEEEIVKLCKLININKASCIDNISSEILGDAFLAVPVKIVNLFNTSFSTAIVPDTWKIAKVTPLQKTGNKSLVSNLRPISILPLTSKLIEKIVHNRIYTFCENNNILDAKQGGFRPGHSTISTTALFLNDIYNGINANKKTYAVFIDAMKAFDTVNHEILSTSGCGDR